MAAFTAVLDQTHARAVAPSLLVLLLAEAHAAVLAVMSYRLMGVGQTWTGVLLLQCGTVLLPLLVHWAHMRCKRASVLRAPPRTCSVPTGKGSTSADPQESRGCTAPDVTADTFPIPPLPLAPVTPPGSGVCMEATTSEPPRSGAAVCAAFGASGHADRPCASPRCAAHHASSAAGRACKEEDPAHHGVVAIAGRARAAPAQCAHAADAPSPGRTAMRYAECARRILARGCAALGSDDSRPATTANVDSEALTAPSQGGSDTAAGSLTTTTTSTDGLFGGADVAGSLTSWAASYVSPLPPRAEATIKVLTPASMFDLPVHYRSALATGVARMELGVQLVGVAAREGCLLFSLDLLCPDPPAWGPAGTRAVTSDLLAPHVPAGAGDDDTTVAQPQQDGAGAPSGVSVAGATSAAGVPGGVGQATTSAAACAEAHGTGGGVGGGVTAAHASHPAPLSGSCAAHLHGEGDGKVASPSGATHEDGRSARDQDVATSVTVITGQPAEQQVYPTGDVEAQSQHTMAPASVQLPPQAGRKCEAVVASQRCPPPVMDPDEALCRGLLVALQQAVDDVACADVAAGGAGRAGRSTAPAAEAAPPDVPAHAPGVPCAGGGAVLPHGTRVHVRLRGRVWGGTWDAGTRTFSLGPGAADLEHPQDPLVPAPGALSTQGRDRGAAVRPRLGLAVEECGWPFIGGPDEGGAVLMASPAESARVGSASSNGRGGFSEGANTRRLVLQMWGVTDGCGGEEHVTGWHSGLEPGHEAASAPLEPLLPPGRDTPPARVRAVQVLAHARGTYLPTRVVCVTAPRVRGGPSLVTLDVSDVPGDGDRDLTAHATGGGAPRGVPLLPVELWVTGRRVHSGVAVLAPVPPVRIATLATPRGGLPHVSSPGLSASPRSDPSGLPPAAACLSPGAVSLSSFSLHEGDAPRASKSFASLDQPGSARMVYAAACELRGLVAAVIAHVASAGGEGCKVGAGTETETTVTPHVTAIRDLHVWQQALVRMPRARDTAPRDCNEERAHEGCLAGTPRPHTITPLPFLPPALMHCLGSALQGFAASAHLPALSDLLAEQRALLPALPTVAPTLPGMDCSGSFFAPVTTTTTAALPHPVAASGAPSTPSPAAPMGGSSSGADKPLSPAPRALLPSTLTQDTPHVAHLPLAALIQGMGSSLLAAIAVVSAVVYVRYLQSNRPDASVVNPLLLSVLLWGGLHASIVAQHLRAPSLSRVGCSRLGVLTWLLRVGVTAGLGAGLFQPPDSMSEQWGNGLGWAVQRCLLGITEQVPCMVLLPDWAIWVLIAMDLPGQYGWGCTCLGMCGLRPAVLTAVSVVLVPQLVLTCMQQPRPVAAKRYLAVSLLTAAVLVCGALHHATVQDATRVQPHGAARGDGAPAGSSGEGHVVWDLGIGRQAHGVDAQA